MPGGRKTEAESGYRAEVARFLQQVRDSAGYPSDAELARDLGVAPSSISHWFSETSDRGASAYSVLRVIRAAEARAPGSTGLPAPTGRPSDQEGIAEAAAAIVKEMRSGFGKLDRRLQALEKRRMLEAARSPAKEAGEG